MTAAAGVVDVEPLIKPGIVESISTSGSQSPEPKVLNQEGGPYEFDVVVIGGGPGGYVSAIRAAQLGAKVALIEKQELGGTCLNVGCIPTKAVISSVALYREMQHAHAYGLVVDKVGYEMDGIVSGAKGVVKQLVSGIGLLLRKNKVRQYKGVGSLVDSHTVLVKGESEEKITTANIIIASGSVPARPPIPGLDEFPTVWTSDNAVFADKAPEKLVVVGAGAVGLEFGYIFNGLGSKVTVVEMMPQIIPNGDSECANELAKIFKKQGIDIRTGTLLAKAEKKGKSGVVTLKSGDKEETLEADVILLAAGRLPMTEGLNLEGLGIKMNKRAIAVDKYMHTNIPGIWAIGDCIGEPLLAHAASNEGEVAAANIMGHKEFVNYAAMPAAVYTHPEYGSVGLTEEKAREHYTDVAIGKFPFSINGRAMGDRHTEGFAKIIISQKYGQILGAHVVGHHASELVTECATAIASEITIDELIHATHAHPTLSEVVYEAAHDARERSVHKA